MDAFRFIISLLAVSMGLAVASCSSDDEPAPLPQEPPEPTMNVSDSLALVEIYKAADGDNWAVTWDLTDIQTWGGVTVAYDSVHNEYRVVALEVNQNSHEHAQGYLSERVGDLTYLMSYGAGGKGITGGIPESLFKLKYLKFVWIGTTSISGIIPGFVFQCPSLEFLILTNNHTGELPEEIAQWDNPEAECRLYHNRLEGKVPDGIKIRRLDLSNNKYKEFPFEYCFTPQPVIQMRGNPIQGTIPEDVLDDWDALRRLYYWSLGDFSNAPAWWNDGPPDNPDMGEVEASSRLLQKARPLKTRLEVRTDILLPGS